MVELDKPSVSRTDFARDARTVAKPDRLIDGVLEIRHDFVPAFALVNRLDALVAWLN